MSESQVYTIGHSNHSSEHFIELLALHHVTAIADVRSTPGSRYTPHFNKLELTRSLGRCGIDYVFLGRELGARSEDRSCYEGVRVQYRRIARTTLFENGLERVVDGSGRQKIALLCTEKDPLDCHRTVLIARELQDRGILVDHILADGSLETHDASMNRLLSGFGLGDGDLFHSHEELVAEALARQEEEIAYVEPTLTSGSQGSLI